MNKLVYLSKLKNHVRGSRYTQMDVVITFGMQIIINYKAFECVDFLCKISDLHFILYSRTAPSA